MKEQKLNSKSLSLSEQIGYLQRSYLREKQARREAEKVIEEKSRELYFANKNLEKLNMSLEQKVHLRTEELVTARKKAEESAKAKERFLANMSHEIRTPMNAIVGFTQLLKKSELDEKQISYINAIETSSENLLVIINDILDFSKITSGKLNLNFVPVNLCELLRDLIYSFQIRAELKNLKLTYNHDEKIDCPLISDPIRLQQILNNLMSNAIKFTNNGEVNLSCNLIQDDPESQTVELKVTDTGIGIDKDKTEVIFEDFSQEDESISRKFGGTGLGLAISKQLIKLLGGDINVVSKKGEGASFSVVLTLKKCKKNALKTNAEKLEKQYNVKNMKVLLVEDNTFNQLLVESILKPHKVEVTSVPNGKIALENLSQYQYDVILMDIQMPVMDGMEATRKIREELRLPIPIIALTANALEIDKKKYLNAGMDDYLSKPFEEKDLLKVLSIYNTN